MARRYRSSDAFMKLMRFVARFRSYSPFNAMLAHIQMPGARYVAPASRWLGDYGRSIVPGARPIVLLQPGGPVMFVFDVSQTEPLRGAPPLPQEIVQPFGVRRGHVGEELERVRENAKRDGVRVTTRPEGSQSAGRIQRARDVGAQKVLVRIRPQREYVNVPIRYDLLLNAAHSRESRYATLVHELAHLYCGHLGTPNPRWWPDRRGLPTDIMELEAESVAYLVCMQLGIDPASDTYLSSYVARSEEMPAISPETVMTVAGLVERMAKERMKPRGFERRR